MKLVLVSLLCLLLSFILEDIQITKFGQFVGSAQRLETLDLRGIWETLLASIGNWFVTAAGDWAVYLSRLLLESNPCCIQMIQLCYMVPSFLAILFWFNSHQVLFCKEPFKEPLSFGNNRNIGGFLVLVFFFFPSIS